MTSIVTAIFPILLSMIVQESRGQHHYYTGGNFLDNILADVILQLIDFVQNGLIDAHLDNFPIPDLTLSLDGKTFVGICSVSDMRVMGVTGFKVKNISSNVFGLYTFLNVMVPNFELIGNYELKAKTYGLLPIYGKGRFSLKIAEIEIGGRGQLLKGLNFGERPFSWKISNFFLTIDQINLTLEGLMGNSNLRDVLLIITGVIILITAGVVLVGWLIRRIYNRIRNRNVTVTS